MELEKLEFRAGGRLLLAGGKLEGMRRDPEQSTPQRGTGKSEGQYCR